MSQKARSRLGNQVNSAKSTDSVCGGRHSSNLSLPKGIRLNVEFFINRLPYLKTFFLSAFFYGLVWLMILFVHPSQIQNVVFPNSYLPFQLLLFAANFFFFSFMTLNSRRGFLISACVSTVLFLQLQKVLLTDEIVISLVILFVIIELSLSWLEKYFNR